MSILKEALEQKRYDSIKIVYGAVDVITKVCNWYHKCDDCPFLKTNHRCGLQAAFGSCTPNNWSTDIKISLEVLNGDVKSCLNFAYF